MNCAFHARNPVTGNLAYCVAEPVAEVIVAVVHVGGRFYGDGVLTAVCAEHAHKLREDYGALPVYERDEV